MFTLRRFFLSLVALIVLTGLLVPLAFAKVISSERLVTISADEVIDDDLFIAGEEISIEGIVEGDVYAAGARIVIDGTVEGDVYAAGGIIVISGNVGQDVLLAAEQVSLEDATIGDGITVAASEFRMDDESSANGGVLFASAMSYFDGSIGRNIMGAGAVVNLGGQVTKDVWLALDTLYVQENVSIGGDLVYQSEREWTDEDTLVGGEVLWNPTSHKWDVDGDLEGIFERVRWGAIAYSFVSYLLIALLLLHYFPKQFEATNKLIAKAAFKHIVIGAFMLLAVPIVSLVFFISVIGIPLGMLTIAFFLLYLYLAKAFVAVFIGQSIQKAMKWKKANPYLMLTLGLLVYTVLVNLPWIGPFIVIVSLSLALGSTTMMSKSLIEKFEKGKIS
jgi:hypothetical protein